MQELHSAQINYFPEENIILPTTSVAIQFPLVKFDYKSGGTRIIPKTHLSDKAPTCLDEEDYDKRHLVQI